jgi:hypothetical protein
MKRAAILFFAFSCLAAFASAPVRLDDSASPRSRVDVKPRWQFQDEGLSAERISAMVAHIPNLEVRLNTSRFVGRQARVYLVVPNFVPGLRAPTGMRVEWRTRGTLIAGSALPGTRALVYDGAVARPVLSDFLDVSLFLDARFVDSGLRFEPYFEIELAP